MKPDVGTKISQVFLQVTHVSALGNLAQAKDTAWIRKGPGAPSLWEEVLAVEGWLGKEAYSPLGTHPLLGCLCPSDVHRPTCSWAALTGHGVTKNKDKKN